MDLKMQLSINRFSFDPDTLIEQMKNEKKAREQAFKRKPTIAFMPMTPPSELPSKYEVLTLLATPNLVTTPDSRLHFGIRKEMELFDIDASPQSKPSKKSSTIMQSTLDFLSARGAHLPRKPPTEDSWPAQAFRQGSQIVERLLKECVFKNEKRRKTKKNEARSTLEAVIDRDLQKGARFRRAEIETMMRDTNFASTYSDTQKYLKK